MEEIEVPTEHLHETIEEKVEEAVEKQEEKKGSMYIAISTALMAVFAALASLVAGHHSDEAVIEQIKSSDHWAFYQAKGIKAEILTLAEKPGTDTVVARYKKEQADLMAKATEAQEASEEHLKRHSVLARAVTMFQISIAISAIAILTRRKQLWWVSIFVSGIGLWFFASGLI
jgi:hypothetical protein